MKYLLQFFVIAFMPLISCYGQTEGKSVTINVDLNKELGTFNSAWSWFGYDEPNYTYMKDGTEAAYRAGRTQPRSCVYPDPQPSDLR